MKTQNIGIFNRLAGCLFGLAFGLIATIPLKLYTLLANNYHYLKYKKTWTNRMLYFVPMLFRAAFQLFVIALMISIDWPIICFKSMYAGLKQGVLAGISFPFAHNEIKILQGKKSIKADTFNEQQLKDEVNKLEKPFTDLSSCPNDSEKTPLNTNREKLYSKLETKLEAKTKEERLEKLGVKSSSLYLKILSVNKNTSTDEIEKKRVQRKILKTDFPAIVSKFEVEAIETMVKKL